MEIAGLEIFRAGAGAGDDAAPWWLEREELGAFESCEAEYKYFASEAFTKTLIDGFYVDE